MQSGWLNFRRGVSIASGLNRVAALLVLAGILWGVVSVAQGQTTQPGASARPARPPAREAPATGAAPQRSQPAPVLPPGREASPQAAGGDAAPQRIETIMHGHWTLSCRDTLDSQAKKQCSATLTVTNQQRQVLMRWIIARDEQGQLVLVLRTPTGVRIKPGVDVKLGNGSIRKAEYVACDAQRCEALLVMDAHVVREALAAEQAAATIHTQRGQAVRFDFPVRGINKVLPAL